MRRIVGGLLAFSVLSLGSCGAGLIGGVVSSNANGNNADARIPQLSISNSLLPLVPVSGDVRTVLVADAQLSGGSIEVRIETASGVIAVQNNTSAQVQGGSTLVSFELDLVEVVSSIGDPTADDVPASLAVFADGKSIAVAIPVLLVRQPVANLQLPVGVADAKLSPFGQRVRIQVDGLLSTDASSLQVLVTTRDPDAGVLNATITRPATDISFVSSVNGIPTIEASIPGNPFPDGVQIQVLDAISGQGTLITNAFYRPEIVLALPGQGPTTGGTLLTLIGSALVPYDFGALPVNYDFDKVEITLTKDGRITELPRDDLRVEQSARDRLVLTVPPSPDGRPGVVNMTLRIELENHVAIATTELFFFANPDPFFGPRGAVLDQESVAAKPIVLDNAPSSTDAPDFAILTEQGGVGFLELLLAQQNGMFQPFAAKRQVGNHEVAAERNPRDLLVGDFDGDAVPDLFIVNEGEVGGVVHHVVLGQQRPGPPLGDVTMVSAAVGAVQGVTALLDGDLLPDILLVPPPIQGGGSDVQVLLSRPLGHGQPSFISASSIDFGDFAYEAIEVADLDGDQILDVAMVSGSELQFGVAFGLGDGSFRPAQQFDIGDIPVYGSASPQSQAVGLHSCQNGDRPSLALVLSGFVGGNPPTVAVLNQEFDLATQEWSFSSPEEGGIFVAPEFVEPFGKSLLENIDGIGEVELVVSVAGEPTFVSGGVLQFDSVTRSFLALEIENGTAVGTEVPVQVSALSFGKAFASDGLTGEKNAVFVVHEVDVDSSRERRLSTRLVQEGDTPRLLTPDAGASLPLQIESVVPGLFSGSAVQPNQSALDLALSTSSGPGGAAIQVIVNDGFGGFPAVGASLSYPGLLPGTVAVISGEIGRSDSLVFISRDSQVGVWNPLPTLGGPSNGVLLTAQLPAVGLLDEDTKIKVADVDGDGLNDLVLLLSTDVSAPGIPDTNFVLMRGKAVSLPSEFPYEVPVDGLLVHANATSFALADFSAGQNQSLQMAVTVPVGTSPTSVDGNHILFCRYLAGAVPAEDRFVISAVANGPQQLLAGSEPVFVEAADFDGDDLVDLMVACRGDRSLRLFRNTVAPGGTSIEVDVGAFAEALASPMELAAGLPVVMKLSDVNGDGNLDVVVATEFSGALTRSSVASYLSTGTGEFSDAGFVSAARVGLFPQRLSLALGDWNTDDVPDLFIGWALQDPFIVNLRVLFGGTR